MGLGADQEEKIRAKFRGHPGQRLFSIALFPYQSQKQLAK